MHTLHVEVHGDGEPVVLLHSSGMSGRQWRSLGRALAPTHRAIVPDLLGYGGSGPWPADAPFTLDDEVSAVLAVVRDQGGPVHLVGHSYGGFLALSAARALPRGAVRSLALYEPVAWGVVPAQFDPLGPAFFDPATGGSEAWFRTFVDYWNVPGAWDALPRPQRDAFLAVGRKVFLEVRGLCFDRTPATAYAELDIPTWIGVGGRSPIEERRVCDVLAATMPRATLQGFPDLGHMGPLVGADAVNAAILAHLG